MTKFFNKFKKPCFWPIFVPFSQFWWQKFFSRKSGSVTHNFIWVSQLHIGLPPQNLEKTKDTIQRKRPDRRKDGRTDRP